VTGVQTCALPISAHFTSFTPAPAPVNFEEAIRHKRQLLATAAFASGVLGTFLGLFNEYEISQIRSHVANLESSQNMLLHISHVHDQ
jgi:hypothetical protein